MTARFLALFAASLLLVAIPARAADPDAKVSIVYTGMNVGTHGSWSTMNEVGPLYDPNQRGDVVADGLTYDVGTLRHGGWYLWGAEAPLTAKTVKDLFAGDGLVPEGPGQSVPALISDYAAVFQQPDGEPAWLVAWLDARLRERGETPDVRSVRGTLMRARGASGGKVWLFAEEGTPPLGAALRATDGWYWVGAAGATIRRGKRETHLVSLARRFGGPPLVQAARRLADERGALRVDAGGLVENANDLVDPSALEDTLEAVPGMKLDALVPFKYELWLPPDKLTRLAAGAPLVAANLTGPDGVPIRPYVLKEVNGLRIALIGLADKVLLAQYGLLGARTGWRAEDPEKALRKTISDVRLDAPDAIILVTNVAEERLGPLRDACEGCAAVITHYGSRSHWSYRERFEVPEPARLRWQAPWIVTGAGLGQVGILELAFSRPPGGRAVLVSAANEGRVVRDEEPALPGASWRDFELYSDFVEARRDLVLPDVRRVSARDKRVADKDGDPLVVMGSRQWSALAAASLRQGTGAEVAVIHGLHGGNYIVGDLQRYVAEGWLPNGIGVATAQLTGAEIKKLLATDPDRRKLVVAGYNPDGGLVGGRPLVDAERYLVVTADTLAQNESFDNVFHDSARTALKLRGDRILPGKPGDRVSIRDAVMAKLDALKTAHGGAFDDAYLDDLARLLTDDGHSFESRWLVALKPCEGTYQQLTVTNRESFGEVRNSKINTPNNTAVRARGNMGVTYETADLDWENKSLLEYQRAEFQSGTTANVVQEVVDNVQLTSEFRLKVFKLQTPRSALELVPFVNGNYLTEFTPTVDPKTNVENARRQEVNGILGAVLYPRTWVKEFRVGAIAKDDLVVAKGGFEPGVQLATSLEVPVGAYSWTFDADLKNYFRTPEDTAEDLGLIAQVATGFRFPLFGGFALRVGVDATYFTGKLGSSPPVGSSIVPTVGLTYNATWKPAVGLVY